MENPRKFITIRPFRYDDEPFNLNWPLFIRPLRNLSNNKHKPEGGLWACEFPQNPYIRKIGEHNYILTSGNNWINYLANTSNMQLLFNLNMSKNNNAIIFELKRDAKILYIKDAYSLINLVDKYPLPYLKNEMISLNYELLSKDYDGLYIENYNAIQNELSKKNDIRKEILDKWHFPSLLLFNLDAINKYISTKAYFEDLEPATPFYNYFNCNIDYKLELRDKEKIINPKSLTYQHISNYAYKLLHEEIKKREKNKGFSDYEDYNYFTVEKAKEIINNLLINKNETLKMIACYYQINEKHLKLVAINIVLSQLSQFYSNNVEFEKNLPKPKLIKTIDYWNREKY